MLKGKDNVPIEQIEKWTKPLLDEFFNIVNYDDTLKEICEKFSNQTIGKFLECVFNEVKSHIA